MRCLSLFATIVLFSSPVLAADPPVIHSARSGAWSSADTWEGKVVPGAGARVLIREGHRIDYDIKSDAVIRGINVAGTLAFDPNRDTVLNVGLIKIQPGDEYSEDGFDCDHAPGRAEGRQAPGGPELVVGTPEKPIAKSALIRLHYVAGMNKESCPAIICCGGRWESHGQPMNRTWVKLGATAKAGDNAVSLAEAVTGWKVGDRIIVTGSQLHGLAKTESTVEERIVTSLEGSKLGFDNPLTMRSSTVDSVFASP